MIKNIAYELNRHSHDYKIGTLQNIRKVIKFLNRTPCKDIFNDSSMDKKNDEWAFHIGGRRELQFNIGLEDEGFRYGIALSFEPSRSLPDISILYPKAQKLNKFIRQYPHFFNGYKMWYYQESKKFDIPLVQEISDKLIKPHNFIFIGKLLPENNIDFNEVLETFDELLQPYIFVEKDLNSGIIDCETNESNEFK